jgi:predicted site-specific integrase-resolvase
MRKDEMKMKEALKNIAQKVLVSKLTFTDWCDRGFVKFRTEKHGRFEYRIFKKSEIERIKGLLPAEKERVIGKPLLPKS